MKNLGYLTPKEFQLRSLSRIVGGHSIIGIAPDGAGKTTTYVLGALMRLTYTQDEAPKVLVLAPNEEKINAIVEQFLAVSQNPNLHIMGLKTSGNMEEEIEDLVRGVDIVVATPDRARAVYLKLGLNLNRIQTFIIDDADEIVKQGMQTRVRELAQSCGKVQYLAFSTVAHEKLHLMIDDFMPHATIIEVEELAEHVVETHELLAYRVPNFTTKINLLNLLLEDDEVFDKVVVFANSLQTVQKLSQSLHTKKGEVGVLNPSVSDETGFADIVDFKQSPLCRVLLVANESTEQLDLAGIPFIIHFDIPENITVFEQRVAKTDEEVIAITFATDIELPIQKKIEQWLGKNIPVMPLPDGLTIYKPSTEAKDTKTKEEETKGAAFHKKKESNSKTHNYGGGTKAKMTMKNKKR